MAEHSPRTLCITEAQAGQRVDKALHMLFPNLSTRGRKLLWEEWHIQLNGRKVAAGVAVRTGDCLSASLKQGLKASVGAEKKACHAQQWEQQWEQERSPVFLEAHEDWLFFSKPRGLHSAAVQGGSPSVEAYLQQNHETYGELFLCNRLDAQTSGIVVASRSEAGRAYWQDMENRGLCQKRYVALVQGQVQKKAVRAALDTDKRKISRVLDAEAPLLRHSYFFPLQKISAAEYATLQIYFPEFAAFPEQDFREAHELNFVGCTIYKGARHQIRAHAAFAGFPLWGDRRYILRQALGEECFLLHHGALHYEHGVIQCAASWEEALQDTSAIKEFFR